MAHKKENAVLYGNLTFGQLAHFAVEIAGRDCLVAENLLSTDVIDAAYKEKVDSYEIYKMVDDDSVFGAVRKFFKKLESEFPLDIQIEYGKNPTEYNGELYRKLIKLLFEPISMHRLFDIPQKKYVKRHLCIFLLDYQTGPIIAHYHDSLPIWQPLCNFFETQKKSSFGNLFADFCQNANIAIYEDFYKKVNDKICDDKTPDAKRVIERCRKENIFPKWNIFYPMLKVVYESSKEYTWKFLDLYFYQNFKNALQNISISKSDWLEFENNFSDNKLDFLSSDFLTSMEKEEEKELYPFWKYTDNLLENNSRQNTNQFLADLPKLRNQIPHSLVFWENWFMAKDCVFKWLETGEENWMALALKLYREAFDKGKYFAGKALSLFLTEAIAVDLYWDFYTDSKKALDRLSKSSNTKNDIKTPLTKNSKAYYSFGYAVEIFDSKKDDTHKLVYNCRKKFWQKFEPISDFSKELSGKDIMNESGIFFRETIEDNEEDVFFLKADYEKLKNISHKQINNKFDFYGNHNVRYTPLSFAVKDCSEKKFLDLANKYLDEYPELDVNVPNTNNTYPISEALTQYKWRRSAEMKTLIKKILAKTNKATLFTESNRSKISVMQEAIECCDAEIMKLLLDKMTDGGKTKLTDNFTITADEGSPLYYAIVYKRKIKEDRDGSFVKTFMNRRFNAEGINFKNSTIRGMTTEEKKENWYNDRNSYGYQQYLECLRKSFQSPEMQERLSHDYETVDEIIYMLIDYTENVDGYIYQPLQNGQKMDGQKVTALGFAIECKFVNIVQKLLDAGANPALVFTNSLEMPSDSPVKRAIDYHSWDCLILLLEQKADLISRIKNEKFVVGRILLVFPRELTLFEYFFEQAKYDEELLKDREKFEKIKYLFGSL